MKISPEIKKTRSDYFWVKFYGKYIWTRLGLRSRRVKCWRKLFEIGENFRIQDEVIARRHHIVPDGGRLVIGNNVGIAEKTDIDYTGTVKIGNGVMIGAGTTILSHAHPIFPKIQEKITFPKTVEICDDTCIFARVLIVPTKDLKIGKNAIVAAGAVVTKSVPDFAIVAGVPAKPIGWNTEDRSEPK